MLSDITKNQRELIELDLGGAGEYPVYELYSIKSVTTEAGFDCCVEVLTKMLSDNAKNLLDENERVLIIKTMLATLLSSKDFYLVGEYWFYKNEAI